MIKHTLMPLSFVLPVLIYLLPGVVWAQRDWQASVISPAGKPEIRYVEDYASRVYSDAWDFSEGDNENITLFRAMPGHSIKAGSLQFKTTSNSEFGWGAVNGSSDDSKTESICQQWRNEWSPWVVRVKITQTMDKSVWYAQGSNRGGKRKKEIKVVETVVGAGEQIITFHMGICRYGFTGLSIGTVTPGNDVSIDWVKIERPSLIQYYTAQIDIENQPMISHMVIGSSGRFSLYINGEKIAEKGGKNPFGRRLNLFENLSGLRQGNNTILVKMESVGWLSRSTRTKNSSHFFLESHYYDVQGREYRLYTDKSWRGAYQNADEISIDDPDTSRWQRVIDHGSLAKNSIDGRLPTNRADYLGPPYLGRIKIKFDEPLLPIVSSGVSTMLGVTVIGLANSHANVLEYKVLKDKKVLQQKQVELHKEGMYQIGELKLESLPAGAYVLDITYLNDGKKIDQLTHELLSVGKLEAKGVTSGLSLSDGVELKKVFEVDLDESQLGNIDYGTINKKVKTGKLGQKPGVAIKDGVPFIHTGSKTGSWFGVPYSLENVSKPHLIRMTIPNAVGKTAVFSIIESTKYRRLGGIGRSGGVTRASNGVIFSKGGADDRENHINEFIFWPAEHNGEFVVINLPRSSREGVGLSKIEIFEVETDLPALDMDWSGKTAMVGPFVERIDRTTPRYFYNGPRKAKFSRGLADSSYSRFYTDWYNTIYNLIRYLRFTGQNTYFAGIYMYYGGAFPSKSYQGNDRTGTDYHGAGWNKDAIALMAKIFEANELNLVLGVQFMGSRNLRAKRNVSDFDMRNGHETLRLVSKDGKQVYGLMGEGYNFIHDEVAGQVYQLADEIAQRYAGYSAIKGVTWMRVPEFRVSVADRNKFTPLDVGYGDTTVKIFESDSGIKIPVSDTDPLRFKKRYSWLRKNHKVAWEDWRTKKVHKMDEEIYNILTQYRGDWCLWKLSNKPRVTEYKDYHANEKNYWSIYRQQGSDPDLYQGRACIKYVGVDVISQDDSFARRHNVDGQLAVRKWNADENTGDTTLGGIFLRTNFILEKTLFPLVGINGWKTANVVSNGAPASWERVNKKLGIMHFGDNAIFPIGWSDMGHFVGHEQEIRKIMKTINSMQ